MLQGYGECSACAILGSLEVSRAMQNLCIAQLSVLLETVKAKSSSWFVGVSPSGGPADVETNRLGRCCSYRSNVGISMS